MSCFPSSTYIPLGLELFQSHKRLRDGLVGHERLVLLQRALAYFGVVRLGYGILQERAFQLVDGDDDAEDLGERVLQVALGARLGELDLLRPAAVSAQRLWPRRASFVGGG